MADSSEYSVLLIDDDPCFREIVRSVLQARGVHILEAASGKQATQTLEQHTFDLLIVDGVLPDTTGVDWISELRRNRKHKDVSVVYASSLWLDLPSYKLLTDDLKVLQVLHKPIVPTAFAELIVSLLQRKPPAGAPPEKKAKVSAALEQLAAQYIAELPDRLNELKSAIESARKDPKSAPDVRMHAHKIRGTAGSFGLHKLGDLLGTIEDKIQRADSKALKEKKFWSAIEQVVSEAASLVPEQTDAPKAVLPARAQSQSSASLALARILVVDDDPIFLGVIGALGKQRLIEIVPASSSKQALELMTTAKFDAAILDVRLEADGVSFELARQLRSISGQEKLPIAFASASRQIYNRVAAAHAGAALYLTKPLEPDALEAAVQQLVAIKRRTESRILVVDDDSAFAELVSSVLKQHQIRVETLCEPVRILDTMHEFNPDLVLLDIMMPGISGFDVCKMLRTVPRWQDLPIIFLTAQTGIETRVAAFQSGGDDYLPKPFAEEELLARVKLRIERATLLKERAEKDPITGLWLRRPFMEQLHTMLSAASKHGFPVAVGMMDLDHLKMLNDTNGHLSGDGVLAGLGRLIGSRFNSEDVRGRWGGDEFIIAFHGESRTNVHGAAASFIREFQELRFPSETGQDFHATASVGLSFFPEDGETIYQLLRVADRRLYLAKESGRNLVVSEG